MVMLIELGGNGQAEHSQRGREEKKLKKQKTINEGR